MPKERILLLNDHWYVVYDQYPVSQGHMLVIPIRHCETFFDISEEELSILAETIREAKFMFEKNAPVKPDGYNIGCNCGKAAGQTVMHFHMHIIPRYAGDVDNPRGGVRGVIPGKQKY